VRQIERPSMLETARVSVKNVLSHGVTNQVLRSTRDSFPDPTGLDVFLLAQSQDAFPPAPAR
jgi:hypothetical protein